MERTPTTTPWGKPDRVHKIADGIAFFSTPSHGGYWVAAELFAKMPENFKRCSYSKNQWFEEDCSWCAVVLAFPQHFGGDDYRRAKDIYNGWYALKLNLEPIGAPNINNPALDRVADSFTPEQE